MHPLLLESTVRQCREYIEAGDCHGEAPPTERLIDAVVQLAASGVAAPPVCAQPSDEEWMAEHWRLVDEFVHKFHQASLEAAQADDLMASLDARAAVRAHLRSRPAAAAMTMERVLTALEEACDGIKDVTVRLAIREAFTDAIGALPAEAEQGVAGGPKHVCGLQGFGALDDECPACTLRRQQWDARAAARAAASAPAPAPTKE